MADGNIDPKTIEAIERQIKGFGENINALGDNTKRELTEMRALIDEGGKKDVVRDERINKMAASVETAQNAIETGLQEIRADVEKVATAVNRTGGGWRGQGGEGGDDAAYQFALAKMANSGQLKVGGRIEPDQAAITAWAENFGLYMRRDDKGGAHAVQGAFQAALQTGSDPDGGYLVPTEVSRRIIEKAYETSPMDELAFTETIGGKELEIPRDEAEAGAGWVGETDSRPETSTPTLGMSKIVAHEMYASPKATQNMLEDAGLDVEGWLARKVGEKFGRLRATAFLLGNGVNQPRGLLTYPDGTNNGQIEQIASGAAADFTYDGLINTVFSLKDPYEANASWMMNRLGIRNVAKLKDLEGRYVWDFGNTREKMGRATLLGYPARRATDVAAPGAGALMAAFGDFKQGYTIVQRLGVTTLRDPYTNKPFVIFYSRARVGGDVVNFEAVKLVKGAAS